MKNTCCLIFCMLFHSMVANCQSFEKFADSIRVTFGIPELNYAIVKSNSILEIKSLGSKRKGEARNADLQDRFRLGSNTKTITSYIASTLVKKGLIQWETKFFDLFPELRESSDSAYFDFTLRDFTCLRANLIRWTYTNELPLQSEINGDEKHQRYEFIKWVLKQKPIIEKKPYYFSNPSYVIVAMMLEKVSGKDYNELVKELGTELGIDFQFGQPNLKDTNQTWGHDNLEIAEPPFYNYKLEWLNSAGNINVNLSDYVKFIQLQLNGLQGNSTILSEDEFTTMHYGLPDFAYGWKWFIDETSKQKYSYHIGNPGTFLTEVYICKDLDLAYVFFANIQSDKAENGLEILFEEVNTIYGK